MCTGTMTRGVDTCDRQGRGGVTGPVVPDESTVCPVAILSRPPGSNLRW
jgi:hypothetical protein